MDQQRAVQFSSTFVLVLNWWLDKGMPLTPNEINDVFRKLIAPIIGGVTEKRQAQRRWCCFRKANEKNWQSHSTSCRSAIPRPTFAQSRSLTFVLTVTRVAAITPTIWATGFPEGSYASRVNVPA